MQPYAEQNNSDVVGSIPTSCLAGPQFGCLKKKLLVLDINGVLVDLVLIRKGEMYINVLVTLNELNEP